MSAIEKQQGGTTWRKHNSFEATEDLVCWMLYWRLAPLADLPVESALSS